MDENNRPSALFLWLRGGTRSSRDQRPALTDWHALFCYTLIKLFSDSTLELRGSLTRRSSNHATLSPYTADCSLFKKSTAQFHTLCSLYTLVVVFDLSCRGGDGGGIGAVPYIIAVTYVTCSASAQHWPSSAHAIQGSSQMRSSL